MTDSFGRRASSETGRLRALTLDTEYRTGETDLATAFFAPCLGRARNYDRAVGYFRSSVFAVLGDAVIDFAFRGGSMRFVCSPELASEDLVALEKGYADRTSIVTQLLDQEIGALLSAADTRAPTELLATLIALGHLDVRIALRPPAQGIFHEKIGLFRDAFGDAVSFKGSSNETWSGWHDRGNLESIEVFRSWVSTDEFNRVRRHERYFERLWSNEIRDLSVIAFPDAAREKLCRVARDSLESAAEAVRDAASETLPRDRREPLQHQEQAIANWKAAGRRGVFQHATGSGKTFTAIMAIRDHLQQGIPAIVAVPSALLIAQWEFELGRELPNAKILIVGAGHSSWRRSGRVESFTSPASELGPRVILTTVQTASKPEFRARVRAGEHLMIVADEVHQVGSPEYSSIFELNTGPRLGLSATPHRYGDPEGTQRLLEYFGAVVPPIVTLQDGIKAGRLVEYRYYPHPVYLTDRENEKWREATLKISREVARSRRNSSGDAVFSDRAKLLLIERARIAKKATGKISLATDILRQSFSEGQRWLVYCEDLQQMRAIRSALRGAGLDASEYYSGMRSDPAQTLAWLDRFGGIVVSVRCLDEGVDIPSVTNALILASSQNPRQFIQRRGRVLRQAPHKFHADVHDAIVVPPRIDQEPEQAALARSEIARALQFSAGALNLDAGAGLRDIAADIGLDLERDLAVGLEDVDPAGPDATEVNLETA